MSTLPGGAEKRLPGASIILAMNEKTVVWLGSSG